MYNLLISQFFLLILCYTFFFVFDFKDIIFCRLFCKNNILKPNSVFHRLFTYKNTIFDPHLRIVVYPFILVLSTFLTSLIVYVLFWIFRTEAIYKVLNTNIDIIILIVEIILIFVAKEIVHIKNNRDRKTESQMTDDEYNKLVEYLNNTYPNFKA